MTGGRLGQDVEEPFSFTHDRVDGTGGSSRVTSCMTSRRVRRQSSPAGGGGEPLLEEEVVVVA